MGLKTGVIGIAVLLAGCAERAEPAVDAPQMNAVERNRMYLAQEREMLKEYIETHELVGIVRDGYGMYALSMVPGTGMTAEMGDEVIYQATVYLLDDSGVGQYTDTVELGYSQIDSISISNQTNRYLRTAVQYIENVGLGEFPKALRR